MTNTCLEALEEGAGRAVGADEADALFSRLQSKQRQLAFERPDLSERDVAAQAAQQIGDELHSAAYIQKRNALINATIRAERVQWVQKNFGARPAEGLEAILVGVNRAKSGARLSVMSVQKTLRDKVLGGFVYDLEKLGATKILASGVMDRDISRALWAIGRPDEADLTRGLAPMAADIAKVINKWQEWTRTAANEAGAWIGKEAGYIVRQSHDMLKIRNAGFEAWRDGALRFFDLPRMVAETGEQNTDKLLRGIFDNLASGDHMKAISRVEDQPFQGPGNLAKKLSESRVVHFKDADSWFDYNQLYGTGNLREAVAAGLERGTQKIGLLRQLGPNPGAMMDSITQQLVKDAKDAGEFAKIDGINEAQKKLGNFMAAVDGSMSIPGNALWARRGANIRAWQSMAKLGGMIMSQFNDVAVYGSEARYQGRSFLSGMGESLAGLGASLKSEERKELLASIGVYFESAMGEIARTGSFEDAGALTRGQRLFFRLNLGHWWSEKQRAAAAMGMSHHMALQAEKSWDALAPEYRRVLELYEIDAGKWDVVRASAQKQIDGRAYITPDTIADPKIADQVQTYLNDRTGFFQLEPDAKTRAIMLQGTQPGTFLGEFMRFLTQFKSFTGAYLQKIFGRELYGRGYEGSSIFGALGAGNGEAMGIVNVVLWSTLFGYGSMVAKDLVKGRTPRTMNDDPTNDAKVFMAAMAQGGGMGIMGDFVFGEANRFGGGMLSSLAGPTAGAANDIVSLYQTMRDDAVNGTLTGGKVGSDALRVALNNTPYLNLFYTRIALDYLLFYRMQEMMNPGYLSRMEQRVRTQNNQEFLLPPSSVAQ
ncbi:hypothetical protein ACUXAV_000382 [Cupriavidus metallidurans]|uniref:hypothetical protein n=1 Tax=Cupriavidus metallidurans TaxID=119219 RepID=UPI0004937E5F|nr:hypothetical protein [Cupriavidus metallidurans]MDE4918342.1 hypothetical protein [Cupriavidus metallidurans]